MRCSLSYDIVHHFSLFYSFFFNDTATTEIYTLSLHDALPICFCSCSTTRTPASASSSAASVPASPPPMTCTSRCIGRCYTRAGALASAEKAIKFSTFRSQAGCSRWGFGPRGDGGQVGRVGGGG